MYDFIENSAYMINVVIILCIYDGCKYPRNMWILDNMNSVCQQINRFILKSVTHQKYVYTFYKWVLFENRKFNIFQKSENPGTMHWPVSFRKNLWIEDINMVKNVSDD